MSCEYVEAINATQHNVIPSRGKIRSFFPSLFPSLANFISNTPEKRVVGCFASYSQFLSYKIEAVACRSLFHATTFHRYTKKARKRERELLKHLYFSLLQIPSMSEQRVHPAGGIPSTAGNGGDSPVKASSPPSSYVIQVPKDQIYRYPPPENPRGHQKSRRSRSCCRCISWTLGLLVLLVILVGIAAGVLYLVFRPKNPSYSIEDLSIKGLNLSRSSNQSSLMLSPEFNVTVSAENPNGKISIYYEKGSSASVSYSGVELCNGVLPVFYQGSKNVTVFQTALTGNGVVLSATKRGALVANQQGGNIPLEVDLRVPVKVKFEVVKTWTLTFKVGCDLTVDELTENAKIVSKACRVRVDVF
ncbi:hypothetical protein ACLOJK_024933 [Asimina triloba]